ncbi:MAG: TRAP transporter large permease [Bacillota bacterium]|jgi:C4-dicarboxylate transporter DctM subunit
MIGILFGSLFVLLFLTVPIAVALALCTLAVFSILFAGTPMSSMLAQSMVTSMDSFSLMAIPLFMLMGALMSRSGIADKLVDVAKVLTSDTPGGLGAAAIVACMFFAAISGSGPATVAAIGAIMIPAMVGQGYSKAYGAGIVASSSIIGPVIPPSIPMIIYGVTIGVSVTKLFTGGFVPGILMGGVLMVYNFFISKKRGYMGERVTLNVREKLRVFGSGVWALLMPGIVLGGIYGGIFTPTESAAVGVVYSIIVGKFVYKTLNIKMFRASLMEAAVTSATVMIMFGGANTFGRLLTIGKIPAVITDVMLSVTQSPILIMVAINVLLLIIGMFIDTISSVILFAPLFTPLVVSLGYDPTFFGVIMVINLCIGMLTPPLGPNMYIAQRIADCKLGAVLKNTIPGIVLLYLTLLLMIIFPNIIMFLPKLMGL